MNTVSAEPIDEATELGNAIADAGEVVETLSVSLSNELVHLLSEQLYTSPLKAVEELVVNGYDADAAQSRVGLLLDVSLGAPANSDLSANFEEDFSELSTSDDGARAGPRGVIAIFDDGGGMDVAGLKDLWKIGDSPKKHLASQTTPKGRLIIGKFGIGKLATYAIGERITYLTARSGDVHHVVCDFSRFHNDPTGGTVPVKLDVKRVTDLSRLLERDDFKAVLNCLGLISSDLSSNVSKGWTLCLVDHLKPKARSIKIGRLSWVLRTSMPLKSSFSIFLNGTQLESSKEQVKKVVEFKPGELPKSYIDALNDAYKIKIYEHEGALFEDALFPNGVTGEIFVADKSLLGGKSDTLLGRSQGFFVHVRGRLVNTVDALFHNTPLSFSAWNRFRADLFFDDLNTEVTASREGIEAGHKRNVAAAIAREIFNYARSKFEAYQRDADDPKRAKEEVRTYVSPAHVERPMADALVMETGEKEDDGADADRGWFYMRPLAEDDLAEVVDNLYAERKGYKFAYQGLGELEYLTRFSPKDGTFSINTDHELVKAFSEEPMARELVELMSTAEVMLEVYMKEAGVSGFVIGEILGRRDILLRSLAKDRVYSLPSIATALRESKDDEQQLELYLVAAARALGFNAKHISGAGTPDGLARFLDSSMVDTVITLEAKSSQGVPSLSALDFSGLKQHRVDSKAAGCLLVAPSYPGGLSTSSAVSLRAQSDAISCWSVEQLAQVVEASERRHITARQIADIVTTRFMPSDVTTAVEALLADSTDMQELYRAIMSVLRSMFSRELQKGDRRRLSAVTALLTYDPNGAFQNVNEALVKRAFVDLSHASKGAMTLNDDVILFAADFAEITRRVSSLTGEIGPPRSLGTFREKE